jgi:hypothetical protein
MNTHEMSPYELRALFEEAHYHQTISDIVSLIMQYGEDKVTQDIHDMLLRIECVMQPPTEIIEYV